MNESLKMTGEIRVRNDVRHNYINRFSPKRHTGISQKNSELTFRIRTEVGAEFDFISGGINRFLTWSGRTPQTC